MKRISWATIMCAAVAGAASAQPPQPTPRAEDTPAVKAAIARAEDLARPRNLAGTNFLFFQNRLCYPRTQAVDTIQSEIWRNMTVPAAPVYDNLYYVGHAHYGAWILKTSAGLILFDALDNEQEAKDYIEVGLRDLGLDPATLKYLIVSHGHGDHFGGARYLQQKYPGMKVAASAVDWDLMARAPASPRRGPPPMRDMVIGDGEVLTLGDSTVKFFITPGHTQGTLSSLIKVYDKGQPHVVSFWGGSSFPATNRPAILDYRSSIERFRKEGAKAGADAMISNHPYLETTLAGLPKLPYRKPGQPHPMVVGAEAYDRYMRVLDTCAEAALGRLDAAGR